MDWRIGLKVDQKVWAVSLGLRLGGRRVNFFCSPRCSCDCTTAISSVPDSSAQNFWSRDQEVASELVV